MSAVMNRMAKSLNLIRDDWKVYRRLQKHLDRQAVSYPATLSGVELRLLKEIFTHEEARIAMNLSYRFQTVASIHSSLKNTKCSLSTFKTKLEKMGAKGCIFVKYDIKPYHTLGEKLCYLFCYLSCVF